MTLARRRFHGGPLVELQDLLAQGSGVLRNVRFIRR